MPVRIDQEIGSRTLTLLLSGILTKQDYDLIVPETQRVVAKYGAVCLLIEARGFQGWEPDALWKHVWFGWHHCRHVHRIACVGERKRHKLMSAFCAPFRDADIRYFDSESLCLAQRWLGCAEEAEACAPGAPHS